MRFDLMQFLQVGFSSPHLMRRLRHVRQPVLTRRRGSFWAEAEEVAWVEVSECLSSEAESERRSSEGEVEVGA